VFKREKSGSLALDDNPPPSKNGLQNDGFVFKKGIVYETSRSKQGIVREMTGVDGFTCGDGTGTVTHRTRTITAHAPPPHTWCGLRGLT
jgi:hypothetical protein